MNKVGAVGRAVLSWVTSGMVRRLLAFLLGVACVTLANRFGIVITEEQQTKLVGLIMLYIGQSALKEVLKKDPVPQVPPVVPSQEDMAAVLAAFNAAKK